MTHQLLTIDGAQGEGGGQILRSSLALSLVTGRPFEIKNIRANRSRPGLRRQHLTAASAAAEVGQADMQGAELGSPHLCFRPERVRAGNYAFQVGTAGSATLVLQTVLPSLLLTEGDSQLTLEGGTHNPLAPPFDFLAEAYLPLINRMGPAVTARLVRPGFFPAGGGRIEVHISPTQQLSRLEILQRGPITARRVRALIAHLPRHIAERECEAIAHSTGWDRRCFAVEECANSLGPGNVVLIAIESAHVTEMFTGFGRKGLKAERVAKATLREAQAYVDSQVPIGDQLADQLMLPLAIGCYQGSGGGVFQTMALTPHSTTHLNVIRQFLDIEGHVSPDGDGRYLVRFDKARRWSGVSLTRGKRRIV